MSPPIDLPRLRTTLGTPELSRLLDALQRRIGLGRPLTGVLILGSASADERAAVDALFGRTSTRGAALRVDLDLLADILRTAGICDDVSRAVGALRGTIVDRRALAEKRSAQWAEVWRGAATDFAGQPRLHSWLAKLEALGLMRRLCDNDPDAGTVLLRELAGVVRALPASGEPLAAFAARHLGDAHALDPGTPRATLAVRAAARMGGVHFEDDAEGRRAAWASVGIMCDELSTPVLVYNVPARDETPLGRLLRSAGRDAEPVHLSLRLLLQRPLGAGSGLAAQTIHLCENPTIVAMAVERLGERCAPLVCVNGQFTTPVLVLLRQLRAAGARLRYHGDFDPAGLAIARRVMEESGAQPWRFGAADYIAAPKGVAFAGAVGATPWDPKLREVMRETGCVVHEEAVFELLAEDMVRGGAI